MNTLDCGEVNCEYCSKDKCIYMTDNEVEGESMRAERADRILSKLNTRQIIRLENYRRRYKQCLADDVKYGAARHGSLTNELKDLIIVYLDGIESCGVITERERAWLYLYYTSLSL